MERGLLMADTSTSKGGWKAGWMDNICRSFSVFYGPTCRTAAEPEFSCNPMEMKILINLAGDKGECVSPLAL